MPSRTTFRKRDLSGDIGHDIKRNFKLSGDRPALSFDTTTQDGIPITRTLVWERVK
ncbi:MAG TPA: hypothetical protein VNX66_07825 [Candidatus Sulfotelmatobacter sp.]|nr:hypothetical protein [Candidatus Sulfotelmatobacter sp.]